MTGQLRYYSNGVPVDGATVHLRSPVTAAAETNASGRFMLQGTGEGPCRIEPQKTGDERGAITALDAVYVLQAAVRRWAPDAEHLLAGDVSGDGRLTALDASIILKHVVGKIRRFPVAQTCASDWAFIPQPAAAPNQRLTEASVGSDTCHQGAIEIDPVGGGATAQDFAAVLFGDCTGNWPANAGAFSTRVHASAVVQVGRFARTRDRRWRLPVSVTQAAPFHALDVELRYDPRQLRAVAVQPLASARRALVHFNAAVPGRMTIALASATPIDPVKEVLLAVLFAGRSAPGAVIPVRAALDDVPARTGRSTQMENPQRTTRLGQRSWTGARARLRALPAPPGSNGASRLRSHRARRSSTSSTRRHTAP